MPLDLLHERIRRVRHAAGLSQQAVAHKLGVRRSAVSQWEQADGTRPSIGNLTALGLLTSSSLQWLLDGRGHMHLHFDARREDAHGADVSTPQEVELLQLYRRLSTRRRVMAVKLLEQMLSLA